MDNRYSGRHTRTNKCHRYIVTISTKSEVFGERRNKVEAQTPTSNISPQIFPVQISFFKKKSNLLLYFHVYRYFKLIHMSRRAAASGTNENDAMMEDIEAGNKMKSNNVYELMKLRDLQSFISKIYWLVVMCFFAVGCILALVLSDGTFSEVFMAENLLSSIGISAYILLVALMVMCNNHGEMRIILLLTILFFTGCLSGFMLALHLLDINISLQSNKTS